MYAIPERDWKVLRSLREVALTRLCERIVAEVSEIAGDDSNTSHERYLALCTHIKERHDDVEFAFFRMRRSDADTKVLTWWNTGLITPEESQQFSEETRAWVARVMLD